MSNSTNCVVTQMCLRRNYEGIVTINFKGKIYDNEITYSFDSKIIKNNRDHIVDVRDFVLDESHAILFVDNYWWDIHVNLHAVLEIANTDIFGTYDEQISLVFIDFHGEYQNLNIPALVWSTMIGMITTNI